MLQRVEKTSTGAQAALVREPILNRKHRVLGYAVRIACLSPARLDGSNGDVASEIVRLGGTESLASLTNGQAAFLRVSRETLIGTALSELPATKVVLELPADLDDDRDVRAACQSWRSRGFRIAIDDFSVQSPAAGLADIADYLKVDVSDPRAAVTRARTVACFRSGTTTLIAKGVETLDQFESASADGFVCFQGFFFGRPMIVAGREAVHQQAALLRLLRALNDPNLSIAELEDLVKHDAGLVYRILRTVNSAAFATRHTIGSIHQALLLLGRDPVRRWASLWAVAGLTQHAHAELIAMSTVRARMCELMASGARGERAASEAFLLGVSSLLDEILGRPMTEIVKDLPFDEDTRRALCGESNATRDVLDCAIAYERGDWAGCEAIAARAGINPRVLPGAYLEALRWSRELQSPSPEAVARS